MKLRLYAAPAVLLLTILAMGCANIVPPSGGKKDETPPRLLTAVPADSQLRTRVHKLTLRFDEFVVLQDAASQVQIAPLLPVPLTVTSALRTVTVTIPDSLLGDSTTYRISFGKAVQDLHENNPFTGYTYTFSTGDYFDSLSLRGLVTQAATGMPDTGVLIVLYAAAAPDSAVVRDKPLYTARADESGRFSLEGLPRRDFRIYAVKDNNGNMIYDGEGERIAFLDTVARPGSGILPDIALRTFRDISDTASERIGSGRKGKPDIRGSVRRDGEKAEVPKEPATYQVMADTANPERRSFDITRPLRIVFTRPMQAVDTARISLHYEDAGAEKAAAFTVVPDTANAAEMKLEAPWKEDRIYTLRLMKGFATDSNGLECMPSRHVFRTRDETDYARLEIHLPAVYAGPEYLLHVVRDQDTVYGKPVTDTAVRLSYLAEGTYFIRLIVDANGNRVWDTGDLFGKLQPEQVIPYRTPVMLKKGWDNIVDFAEKPPASARGAVSGKQPLEAQEPEQPTKPED